MDFCIGENAAKFIANKPIAPLDRDQKPAREKHESRDHVVKKHQTRRVKVFQFAFIVRNYC